MDFSFRRAFARGLVTVVTATTLALTGCSTAIYKVTGDTMNNIGQDVMLPYLLTIAVLIVLSATDVRRRLGAPAALGVPFVRDER